MTDPKQTFTHISVNDGSDDDIVIQAGSSRATATHTLQDAIEQTRVEESFDEESDIEGDVDSPDGTEDDIEDDEVVYSDEEYDYEDNDGFEREDDEEQETLATSSKRDDGYRQTTLEDLQGTPMSSTQKVVIGVVLVVLVAAVVYFTFFMK